MGLASTKNRTTKALVAGTFLGALLSSTATSQLESALEEQQTLQHGRRNNPGSTKRHCNSVVGAARTADSMTMRDKEHHNA